MNQSTLTRRDFVKKTAGAAIALSAVNPLFGQRTGSDRLRVGLIGAGGRGTDAAIDILRAAKGIQIVAIGDLFPDRVQASLEKLTNFVKQDGLPAEALKVTPERMFSGWDNYKKVLESDVDVVILAAPPHFRPQHLKAAVEAGKHIFTEKPVAVDPVGIRSVLESAKLADEKGLNVVAGTQRRHQDHYVEIMKRIHDGAIGEIVSAQCYWNQGGLWHDRAKQNLERFQAGEWSEMEFQVQNWLFCVWLSGDHIVEQHVHNIDVVNWAIGQFPKQALGMGGRQQRIEPQYCNSYDHFAVEFEYENGVRVQSMCRQIDGASHRVEERIVGTKGVAIMSSTGGRIEGPKPWESPKYARRGEDGTPAPNPYVQEHVDLVQAIRSGKRLNETYNVANSTASAILGRMSAYTGNALRWDWMMNASKLDYTPERYEFGPNPLRPIAVPGVEKVI